MAFPPLTILPKLGQKLAEKTKHFLTSDESAFSQFFGVGDKPSTLVEETKNMGKAILRAPGRAAASVTLSATGQKELKPATKPEKFMFGNEPVKSLGVRTGETKKTLEGFGLSQKTSQVTAPLIIFGATALDLYPGTAGRSKAGSMALKELGEEVASPLIKKFGPTIAGNIADIGG